MLAGSIQSQGPEETRLWVEFARAGDRFVHTVYGAVGKSMETVVVSVEGTDLENWPASPALQQLSIEHREQGDVALLVGMSGRSHWSLSVEAERGRGSLLFDAACLVRQRPERCGSYYRVESTAGWEETELGLRWLRDKGWYELTLVTIAGCPSASCQLVDGGFKIVAPPPPVLPATVRWRYRLAYQPDR